MNLNSEQKKAVESIYNNIVVTAGAGAGKTTVLSERFLYLLKQSGCGVDQILTLTFTKKAANEMLERIRDALYKSKDPSFKEYLSKIDSATISTLDSFCNNIAKGHFAYYGLPSTASPDEELSKKMSTESALSWLIKNSKKKIIQQIIEVSGFNQIWNELLVPIAQNSFFLVNPTNFANLAKQHQKVLEDDFRKLKETIFIEAKSLGKLEKEYLLSIQSGTKEVKPSQSVLSWIHFANNLSNALPSLDAMNFKEISTFFNFSRNFMLEMPRMLGKVVKGISPEIKEYAKKLKKDIEIMRNLLPSLLMKEQYSQFYTLLDDFQKVILNNRRTSGVVTFNEIALMAVDILSRDKSLRNFYKDKFRYIMVDEFQDNNSLQRDLLFLLAESNEITSDSIPPAKALAPDKLFFVGDEKQSIYRFRGADVSIFKSLNEDLKEANGLALSLSTNYRSEPGLIEFFNTFFKNLMPEVGKGELYEAEFEELDSRNPSLETPARVDFLTISGTDQAPNSVIGSFVEADAVASLVKEYIESKVQVSCVINDLETGKRVPSHRDCKYEDFAILFRKTSTQHYYERVFRESALPYNSQIVTSFYSESLFCDINAFFNLILYPLDRLSYAKVLRSPLCSIDDEALFKILELNQPPFIFDENTLTKTEEQLLNQTKKLYDKLIEEVDTVSHAKLLDIIWFDFGYRYYYMNNSVGMGISNHFDYFRSIAMKFDSDIKNFAQFVKWCTSHEGSHDKLEDPFLFNSETDAISMLTIHKSKGLQFPITIIADTGAGFTNFESKQLYYNSQELGLTVHIPYFDENGNKSKTNYLFERAKETNLLKDKAELNRLLYVGMTRAKDHLIFSGFSRSKESKKIPSFHSRLLTQLSNDIKESAGEISIRVKDVPLKPIEQILHSTKNVENYNLDRTKYNKVVVSNIDIQRVDFSVTEYSKQQESESSVKMKTMDFTTSEYVSLDNILSEFELSAEFGTLCHELLEKSIIGFDIEEIEEKDYPKVVSKFPKVHQAEILDFGIKLSLAFIHSSIYSKLKEDNPIEISCESEFMLKEGANYIKGRADLVVEYENRIEILDFKTDLYKQEGIYDKQMQLYKDAFSGITQKETNTRVIYLRELVYIPASRAESEPGIEHETESQSKIDLNSCSEDIPF